MIDEPRVTKRYSCIVNDIMYHVVQNTVVKYIMYLLIYDHTRIKDEIKEPVINVAKSSIKRDAKKTFDFV